MIVSSHFLLWVLSSLLFNRVDAFWRMVCGTIQTGRLDPIVNPGKISGHSHAIAGPINFNINSNYSSLQNAYCTSCSIQQDKSAYWTPQLYYRHRNGSYEYVNHDGTVVYYLGRGTNRTNIVPFPPGYRVLAGDSGARAYDPTTLTFNGQTPISQRVSFACLDVSGPAAELPYMGRTNCSSGLRAQIHFPSCWNGVDLYKTDQSHVAYLSQIDNGDCPPNYPYLFMHMFFEVIYSVNSIKKDGGMFVFGNGDTTGYGFHGDFLHGWDQTVLINAIAQCANTNDGSITDCPPLAASQDPYFNVNCPEQPAQINETVKGMMNALPGCNPPTGATARAQQNVCPVQPIINYTPNQLNNSIRFVATPGTLLGTWSFLGCTNDNSSTRPIQGAGYNSLTNMTIESCTSYCHTQGFYLAALEYSTQCYCGSQLAPGNPLLSPLVCSTYSYQSCSGNGLEQCGAPYLMQVWSDTSYAGGPIIGVPTTGVTSLNLPSGLATYRGCYAEATNPRALSGATFSNMTGMTLEMCGTYCQKLSYQLFGVEYSYECYCGNSISTAIQAETGCANICPGNKGELCGGPSRLSVWSLPGYVAPSAAPGATATTLGSALSSTPTVTPLTGVTYWGCYSDTNPRVLSGYISNNSISISLCGAIAQQANAKFFGVEYSSQCLYGSTLAAASQPLASSKCYQACAGNGAQICGGPNAISLYNNTLYKPPVNPNPVTVPGQIAQYRYLGCYGEPAGGRALGASGQLTNYDSGATTTMTVEVCAALCFAKGFSYMGVENGNECFCNNAGVINGATVTTNGDADCSTLCVANGTEFCGAPSKLNVYQKMS